MFFVKKKIKQYGIRAPPRSSSKHLCSAALVIIRIRLICGFYNNMMTYSRCRVPTHHQTKNTLNCTL